MTKEIQNMAGVAIKGIQEKKGRSINIVDLEGMPGAITKAFVVCQGNSPSQVSAIMDSVEETMRKELNEKPVRVGGTVNNIWVVMDYTDLMVHIFLPDAREYYKLEELWQDAPNIQVPDFD